VLCKVYSKSLIYPHCIYLLYSIFQDTRRVSLAQHLRLLTKVDDDAMRAPPPFYLSSFGCCCRLAASHGLERVSMSVCLLGPEFVHDVRGALSDEAASESVARQQPASEGSYVITCWYES